MLVYGDIVRRCDPRELLAEVRADLERAQASTALERHTALVSALIGAGELLQGLADAEFADRGADASSPSQDALTATLMQIAQAVGASWRDLPAHEPSPFKGEGRVGVIGRAPPASPAEPAAGTPPSPPFPPRGGRELDLLLSDWPATIEARQPEGYAFYALYPEAYLEAAAALPPGADWRVIGLRSIGTSLAAVVAAALDAPPPTTVRPTGHPFQRELALSPESRTHLLAGRRFAVVDEGPGLSGSSFGAAVDLLQDAGVPLDRVHVFPGHGGDLGPHASERHRGRWPRLQRHTVSTDALLLDSGRLQAWAEALVGPAVEPMRDLSGGAWRAETGLPEPQWPPANAAQERRKHLLRTEHGAWLLKFAGLGRIGERKLARARALHAAGFSPEPAGLAHGFLVEHWIEPATTENRPVPLDRLARYLAFRRDSFPSDHGAGLAALLQMARFNTAAALGPDAARSLDRFEPLLPDLERRVRRVETDNRLHRWEWITAPDDRLLKTDALDHHAAHDLVGGQDVAWDVAGAAAEFDLDDDQVEDLRRRLGAHASLLAFMIPAYLAFQLGYWWMAAEAHAGWPQEAARLTAARDRYASRLRRRLDA